MYNHYGLSIKKGDNVAACGIVEHSVLIIDKKIKDKNILRENKRK